MSIPTPDTAARCALQIPLRAASDAAVLRALFAAIRQLPESGIDDLLAGWDGKDLNEPDGVSASDGRVVRRLVQLAVEVARRASVGRAARAGLQRSRDVAIVAAAELAVADRERLLVLVCDAGNRLLQATIVTEGTADRLLIPVREILALALQRSGRAFAVAHNHPSGDTTPSSDDIEGTQALAAAAKAVGLRFLGHVIVADGRWQAVGSAEVRECGVDG